MKINPCLLLLAALCCPYISDAQTVSPGTVASDLTEQRGGSSIDHATGIMQYSLPLFKVAQDGYDIPVALSYSAAGIKVLQQPGLAGLGWSISYGGGIITRTMKGSAADEDFYNGYLNNPVPQNPTDYNTFKKKVNTNKIDGESDIFHLNIKGNSVKFIIKKVGNDIIAQPLVKTDITITCHHYQAAQINGWTVKDTDGNAYEFVASYPGNAFIQTPVPTNSYSKNVITSWYLKSVQLMNNGKIDFVYYDGQYAESFNTSTNIYNYYGVPLSLPILGNDPNLNSQLEFQKTQLTDPSNTVRIDQLKFNLEILSERRDIAARALSNGARDNLSQSYMIMNKMDLNAYNSMIEVVHRDLYDYYWQLDLATNNILFLLDQMYTNNYNKQSEFTGGGQNNVVFNKLLKKIILRNEIIEFEYTPLRGSDRMFYMYSKINYRTVEGDLMKSVFFDYSLEGQLKKVQVISADKSVEKEYSFNYYNEGELPGHNAQDYWGYNNGKFNSNLFPDDPQYFLYNPQTQVHKTLFGAANIPADYETSVTNAFQFGLADRKPDGSKSNARSLQQVNTMAGEKVTFEYEGNTIYSSEVGMNADVGGIRIKKVTVDPGHGTPIVTRYKYEFPSPSSPSTTISTGRLIEWRKKFFAWEYLYGGTANDVHIYTDPVNLGKADEDYSNNGVLYHYVEEINDDNSATGYKYGAIHSGELPTYLIYPHKSIMDNALLAKIDYNADGKIVRLNRNRYITNQAAGDREIGMGNLAEYYFQPTYPVFPSGTVQVTKEPIYYDAEALTELYSNSAEYQMTFASHTFSLIPYDRIFMPNYYNRCKDVFLNEDYSLSTNDALLLSERQSYVFGDYNPSTAYASSSFGVPDEKAYLYESLITAPNIPVIKTVTKYTYDNPTHIFPTGEQTVDSKGTLTFTRTKYAADYQLPPTDNISKMQLQNYKSAVIEKQAWISKDQGSSYKLLNGERYTYKEITANGQSNFLLDNIYTLQKTEAFSPSTFGYTENAGLLPPFSTVAWDNTTLYKQENTIKWTLYNGFIRPTSILDRSGRSRNVMLYDNMRGFPLLEGSNFDADNAVAIDFSPYAQHSYYNDYGIFKGAGYLYPTYPNTLFADRPFNSGSGNPYTMDHVRFAEDILLQLEQFKNDHPIDWSVISTIPLYQGIIDFCTLIKFRQPLNSFSLQAAKTYKLLNETNPNDMVFLENLLPLELGVDFPEIRSYLNALFLGMFYDYGYQNYQTYEDVMLADKFTVLPVDINGNIPVKVNVENLIATGKDLDVFLISNSSSSISARLYYNGSIPPATYSVTSFSSLSDRLRKKTLQLATLPSGVQLKEIEFLFSYYGTAIGSFVALPANSTFKAYSYLPNGKPYLTINNTGQYQTTFYNQLGMHAITRDTKGNILSVDSIGLAKSASFMNSSIKLAIYNNYDPSNSSSPNITKISFTEFDTNAHLVTDREIVITPNQVYRTEIPPGTYSIQVFSSSPVGHISINNTLYTGGFAYPVTISSSSPEMQMIISQ